MPWADSHGISYIGLSWITSDCSGEPALITNYNGTPTNYGIGLGNHLQALPH
jgi:endoglucanase